jgi:Flp pilus assembly protein TadG
LPAPDGAGGGPPECAAERGAALTETALTLPLLLLVILGLVQFALVVHGRHVVTVAAQESARLAAGQGRTLEEGAAYGVTLLGAGLGRSAARLTVAVAYESPAGDAVVATVAGTLPVVAPMPGADRAGWPVRATARVRTERFRAGRW